MRKKKLHNKNVDKNSKTVLSSYLQDLFEFERKYFAQIGTQHENMTNFVDESTVFFLSRLSGTSKWETKLHNKQQQLTLLLSIRHKNTIISPRVLVQR